MPWGQVKKRCGEEETAWNRATDACRLTESGLELIHNIINEYIFQKKSNCGQKGANMFYMNSLY